MKFMRQYLLSLLLTFAMATGAFSAADVGNSAVISPVDASNGSGTCPSWLGSAAPSTIDDAGRCLQGAIAREWQNRSFAVTSTGSANAYVVAYTVAPAALRTGQVYSFITNFAVTGTATVNINTLGAKTIKKDVAGTLTELASGDMGSGQFVMLAYNGTDMIWVNWQGSGSTAATTTEQLTGTSTSVVSNPDTVAALWEKGSNIASAGTISIGEGGYFHVTGTTTITDIDFATATNGRCAWLIFDGALTLTHNATTLLVPGGANKTTAANDRAKVCQDSGDNVIVTAYETAAASSGTADYQTFTASGTWTKPASGTICTIEAWGGGGSGGKGAAGAAQGGGGGGGYSRLEILMSSLGATETVTIGAGGAAQTTANTAGNAGSNTTFGAHLTGYGGGPGGFTAGGGGVGGGGGGKTAASTTTTAGDVLGGNGGGLASNGSNANFAGAGGGGASSDATGNNGDGGSAPNGGGGGGAGAEDAGPGPGDGGPSGIGGAGGAGAFDASAATAGTQPGGGGGGSEEGNSGAGASGRVNVTCH